MSKEFLARTMAPNDMAGLDKTVIKPIHKQTLSALDATLYKGSARPGDAAKVVPVTTDDAAFSLHRTTSKITPREYLGKGTGLGGTTNIHVTQAVAAAKASAGAVSSPPRAGATSKRQNPPNTELRRYYERGDLPISILQGARNKLQWKADIKHLDFAHYLPIFASGLRESEEPYRFVAEEGVLDLLRHGGESKVLPVVPQLILPFKDAFATRDERIMVRTMRCLCALADVGDAVGQALVPYYRQLLPVLNIFINRTTNLGDGIDYGQRHGHLGELIQDTLQKLEMRGGPDAYINIKYMVPSYESCMLV